MALPSRRLTTLWFADIAGFTRLSATNEPMALEAMEVMRRCVKQAVTTKHGKVIKWLGDGALAEFPSSEGAVEAALEVSALFTGGTRRFEGGPFQLHIGIHVGDVTVSDDDIFGDGVNRAARLQALGEPGEILVSEEVFTLVRRRPELKFTSLGERTAKGLDEPFVVYAVEASGELATRLGHLRAGVQGVQRTPVKRVPHPRAIGVGMAAAVATFAGLAVWTAMGGTATVAESLPLPIPDTLRLPAHDDGFAMPAWPPRVERPAAPELTSRVANMVEETAAPPVTASAIIVLPAPPPNSLAGLARMGEQYMAKLGDHDLSAHEILPPLRQALNEARDGAPTGARADAIRGITLFVVAREIEQAEAAFQASLATDPGSGTTRLMYAELLSVQARFGEASYQLEQAKGKGVNNALLDAARGALYFRQGEYDDAKGALERSLRADDLLSTRILLSRTLVAQNKTDDALRVLDKAIGSFEVVPWMAFARQRGGAQGASRERLVEMAAREDAGYAGALLMLEADESIRALDMLERLVRDKDPDVIWLAADPEWAPLRSDLRFRALVNRALGRH